MIRRSPLKPVSPKRAAERGEYDRAVQRAFARDRYRCRVVDVWPESGPCFGRITPHHIAPQGRFPELRCDVDNIMTACLKHNDWVSDHPALAKELGLLK